MLALGGTDTGIYKFLLLCHILVAIVGLGAVMLNGIYGAQAKARQGPPGRAIAEANFAVTKIAEYFIYAIFVFGILLVIFSDEAFKFSQTWLIVAMTLYIIALGISHGVMVPSTKKMLALMNEMEQGPPPAGGPPPQVAQMEQLGKKLAAGGMTLNLIVVAILVMMIWKPGWP
jgi:uncharacterized membrane protein